jgi:hypothetical protein
MHKKDGMAKNNIDAALAYYKAMNDRNFSQVETYLDPNVQFTTPLAELSGKEAVLGAIKGFMSVAKQVTIKEEFSAGDKVVLIYEVEFPAPIGVIPSVTHMTLHNGLITRIRLYYDARPFDEAKKQIFQQK